MKKKKPKANTNVHDIQKATSPFEFARKIGNNRFDDNRLAKHRTRKKIAAATTATPNRKQKKRTQNSRIFEGIFNWC